MLLHFNQTIEKKEANLFEGRGPRPWGSGLRIAVSLSHFLITANSSTNFAIYCIKVGSCGIIIVDNLINLQDKNFRKSFVGCLTCSASAQDLDRTRSQVK